MMTKLHKLSTISSQIPESHSDEILQVLFKQIDELKEDILQVQTTLRKVQKEALLTRPKKISIPVRDGYAFVNQDEILRCQADGNYTFIFLSDGRRFLQSETLKDIESVLHMNQFVRVHQSHLVNINFVSRYQRNGGHYLIMEDQSVIPISRQRKSLILKILNLF